MRPPKPLTAKTMAQIGVVVALGSFTSACVTNSASGYIVPGETLNKNGSYYIVFSEDDDQALHETLRVEMEEKGLAVSSGFADRMPKDVTYLVEYGAQWQWDITWYLLNFNVRVYEPGAKLLIASSNSQHSSLARKPAGEIVTEALDQLFN